MVLIKISRSGGKIRIGTLKSSHNRRKFNDFPYILETNILLREIYLASVYSPETGTGEPHYFFQAIKAGNFVFLAFSLELLDRFGPDFDRILREV